MFFCGSFYLWNTRTVIIKNVEFERQAIAVAELPQANNPAFINNDTDCIARSIVDPRQHGLVDQSSSIAPAQGISVPQG